MRDRKAFALCVVSFISIFLFTHVAMARTVARMPSFTLKSVTDGSMVESKVFEGKTLLVIFFATWCPPCLQEIPALKALQKEYQKDDFSVVALSVDKGGIAKVARTVKKKAINYPVLMADRSVIKGFGGVYGIPVSFLVNSDGNIVKKYPGYVSHHVLEKDLKKIL